MMKTVSTQRRGFTLLELLMVIAIIGIVATIAFISLGRARTQAQNAKAKSEVRQITLAIQMLYEDTGRWPAHRDTTNCPCTTDDPATVPSTGWSYEPLEEFNCELKAGAGSGDTCNDFTLPWYGLTGLDCGDDGNCSNDATDPTGNSDEYPGWNGPYLPPTFPKIDPWGRRGYVIDGDYTPYQTGQNTVSVMSRGFLGGTATGGDADDIYYQMCWYDPVACSNHIPPIMFCPCFDR